MPMWYIDDPTTKPSGSKPASPSSTYSDTDRSEVKTPPSEAPAVCASLESAACGSQTAALDGDWPENSGMKGPPSEGVAPTVVRNARCVVLFDRSGGSCPIAKQLFLDLSGRGFRQGPEDDGPWRFEMGQIRPAVVDQLGLAGLGAWL